MRNILAGYILCSAVLGDRRRPCWLVLGLAEQDNEYAAVRGERSSA